MTLNPFQNKFQNKFQNEFQNEFQNNLVPFSEQVGAIFRTIWCPASRIRHGTLLQWDKLSSPSPDLDECNHLFLNTNVKRDKLFLGVFRKMFQIQNVVWVLWKTTDFPGVFFFFFHPNGSFPPEKSFFHENLYISDWLLGSKKKIRSTTFSGWSLGTR